MVKSFKCLNSHPFTDIHISRATEHPAIFCEIPSYLGEGPLWSQARSSLFWVDIGANRLYEKSWQSNLLSVWALPETVTSLAEDHNSIDELWLISENAVVRFNLTTGYYTKVADIPLDSGFRTNDGKVSPDGRYWFGSMLRQPQPKIGQVFSMGKDKTIRIELNAIAIPNTFGWMSDGSLLLSDSLRQICLRYPLSNGRLDTKNAGTFIDLTGTSGTPDGGALDKHGNIWLALWGAGKIACYNPAGEQLHEITLSALQPSSCCFGGPNNDMLFITTAKEGLMTAEQQQYPDSGKVFVVQLMVEGAPVHRFSAE